MNQVTFSDLKILNIFEEIEVRNLNLTSLGIEGINIPPIFKKLEKNYFTSVLRESWRKNFTKIFTYRRGGVCSPMPRRCRHRSCPDWLNPTLVVGLYEDR